MTNETQTHSSEHKTIPFGTRLKSAREAMGWERKDVAAQLRLNEKVILMMEKDRYPSDLPTTFIRGYIRAYGKLLQIPEYEVKKAIEPIKPKPVQQEVVTTAKPATPVTSSNYFMQMFTYLIVFTLIGLVGAWWYSHNTQPQQQITETLIPEVTEETSSATPNEVIPATPGTATAPAANNTAAPIPGNKSATFQKPHVPTVNNNNTNPSAASALPVQPKSSANVQEDDEEDDVPAPRTSKRASAEEEDTVSADSEPSSEDTAD